MKSRLIEVGENERRVEVDRKEEWLENRVRNERRVMNECAEEEVGSEVVGSLIYKTSVL